MKTSDLQEHTSTPGLERQLRLMEAYLRMKLEQRDWHGVADAAMDIRELEAILKDRRAHAD